MIDKKLIWVNDQGFLARIVEIIQVIMKSSATMFLCKIVELHGRQIKLYKIFGSFVFVFGGCGGGLFLLSYFNLSFVKKKL